MKTNKHIILTLLGILIAASTLAQESNVVNKTKMTALSALTGKWTGGGWMTTPDRQRVEFTQKENLQYELDGTILYIRGEAFDLTGKQVHNALGVMFYDPAVDKYFMDAFLATGQHTIAEMALTEKGLDWWFQTEQGGTVKYIITIENDTWTEKGYYSPDGVAQYPFMEFTLKKAK